MGDLASGPTGSRSALKGDVNCDGQVNSVDSPSSSDTAGLPVTRHPAAEIGS